MTGRMPGPTSHTFFSQRLRLHYVDWGNPTKSPLVMLHGGRDHCRNWDWAAEALRDEWHILAPDLRGHGDSQWSADGSYALAGYIYDLTQLIHQQRLAPAAIIAHSLGGQIALRYAGIYPDTVARLVAIEGLGPSPAQLKRGATKTIAERIAEWIDEPESRAGNPAEDGRAAHFRHARVLGVEGAGHWLHHDRLDEFLRIVRSFLAQ